MIFVIHVYFDQAYSLITAKKIILDRNSDDDFVIPAPPRKSQKSRTSMTNVFDKFEQKLEDTGVSKEMLKDPM